MCLHLSTPLYNSPCPDSIPPVLLDLSKRVPAPSGRAALNARRAVEPRRGSGRRSATELDARAPWGSLGGLDHERP